MSGAVGSRPSLTRRGTPVASDRASFASHSCSGMSSLLWRFDRSKASRTEFVTGYFWGGTDAGIEADITGCYGKRDSVGRYTAAASYGAAGPSPTQGGRA